MSWWLARIYLCAAILNNVLAIAITTQLNSYLKRVRKSVENENKIILETRSLAAGDSFTPSDMLPIAEKLFTKVDDRGNGHGFVSSSSSPQMLADKLFEAYFSTSKRIVFLKASCPFVAAVKCVDEDLAGLDALQALALHGETVNSQLVADTETEEDDMYLRSKARKMQPKRGKYKLISKNATRQESSSKPKLPKRRRIDLAKYLNKKRHLIVNKQNNKRARNTNETKTSQTKVSSYLRKGIAVVTINPNCRWNYECSNIVDLDTCRIHSKCGKEASNKSINYEIFKVKEHGLEAFRKMMKIHYVDEEVEKILESRNLQRRPPNQAVKERVESLSEYFNKIVVEEELVKSGITKALKTEKN